MTSRRRPERRVDPRSGLVAAASTIVVFGAARLRHRQLAGLAGGPGVVLQRRDLRRSPGRRSCTAFWVNVRMFLIVEVLVLGFALLLAVLRGLPGPRAASRSASSRPSTSTSSGRCRASSSSSCSASASLPSDSQVSRRPVLLGRRRPDPALLRLRLGGLPGGHRVGPSEPGRGGPVARPVSRLQALRHVVLPQAVRRVIPPLLNDFIGLQKDTVLVSFLGVVEIFRTAEIQSAGDVQLHAVRRRRARLPRRHDPAGPARRLARRSPGPGPGADVRGGPASPVVSA